jgi:flagellar assembly factor FliW
MKCAETIELETPVMPTAINAVRIPTGLLGFEQIKEYVLITKPGEEPFAWLQVQDNSALAFVVIDPFVVLPDYQPDIPSLDVEFLGLKNSEDALLLGIVTVHSATKATVNLKGPIVVNRHTHIAKQIIIINAADYSIEHPLPLAETVG